MERFRAARAPSPRLDADATTGLGLEGYTAWYLPRSKSIFTLDQTRIATDFAGAEHSSAAFML